MIHHSLTPIDATDSTNVFWSRYVKLPSIPTVYGHTATDVTAGRMYALNSFIKASHAAADSSAPVPFGGRLLPSTYKQSQRSIKLHTHKQSLTQLRGNKLERGCVCAYCELQH